MPCYLTGTAEGDRALERDDALTEVTRLTRLLCEANRLLDLWAPHIDILNYLGTSKSDIRSKELKNWWKKHKKIDQKRKSKNE